MHARQATTSHARPVDRTSPPDAPRAGSPRDGLSTARPAGAAIDEASREVLARVRSRLRARLGEDNYSRHFEHVATLSLSDDGLDVHVPSKVIAHAFENVLRPMLVEVFGAETGHANAKIRFVIDAAASASAEANARATERAAIRGAAPTSDARPAPARRTAPAPLAKLEDFFVAPCNQVAHQAVRRLLDETDAPSGGSPLFIYGPCGMGKSHLLQGIARALASKLGTTAVRYATAETFMNEFTAGIRADKTDAFKRAWRNLDVLCLDDVSVLTGKVGTQTELQHTLDAIKARGGRIVASGPDHPKRLAGLSDAIGSRLCAGMTARLDRPDATTLSRLVRVLAQRRRLQIEEPALDAIVHAAMHGGPGGGAPCSVRELEGLLTKVEAVHRLLANAADPHAKHDPLDAHRPIGVLCVSTALDRAPAPRTDAAMPLPGAGPLTSQSTGRVIPKPVRIDNVIRVVCQRLGVTEADLRGRSRQERLVLARTLTAHLGRRLTSLSFPEIARALGRPNHSTIITACQRIERQIAEHQSVSAWPGSPHQPIGMLCDRLADELVVQARAQW